MKLIRGDTEIINISFYRDDKKIEPEDIADGDIFTFTMRDQYTDDLRLTKSCIFPKTKIMLTHEDTKNLNDKKYKFDIEYRKPDKSVVKTLIIGVVDVEKDITYD